MIMKNFVLQERELQSLLFLEVRVVDVLISSDMTAAGSALTMPTNYDQKRLIGWLRTEGSSNIVPFVQSGDEFTLKWDGNNDINDNSITNDTFETATITAPPSCIARGVGSLYNTGETATDMAFSFIHGDNSTFENNIFQSSLNIVTANAPDGISGDVQVMTNSSSQIKYTASEGAGTATVRFRVMGCNMLTRSNPL